MEVLWNLRPDSQQLAGRLGQLSRLQIMVWGMALLSWLAVLSGLYVVWPLYRATPVAGASLIDFPQAYLMSSSALAPWHTLVAAWKAHIAVLAPYLATTAAVLVVQYRHVIAGRAEIRRVVMVLVTLAFGTASLAGLLGALLTKMAPLR